MSISNSVKSLTVIGAGVQGHSIVQSALMGNFEKIIINDINMDLINKAVDQIENDENFGLKKLESCGILNKEVSSKDLMEKLVKEVHLKKAVNNSDFIIEAIPEKIELKQKLFKKINKYAPEHAILASNTSTMSITKLANASGRPENVIGMHFFIPLNLKLVEITKGSKTSDNTMKIATEVANNLYCLKGNRVIIPLEKESPGFIANRIITSSLIYFNWILDIALKRGIPFKQIDADIIELAPRGICFILDIVGLDTVYNVMTHLKKNLSPDFAPGETLTLLVKEGKLGKKSGKGFYDWSNGRIKKPENFKKANLLDINAILAIMINEGCR
ncbi:MAG: 3-hydroxyacyl-CoA dehydrogenase family protein, partial [Promethearchaeota archaeon]